MMRVDSKAAVIGLLLLLVTAGSGVSAYNDAWVANDDYPRLNEHRHLQAQCNTTLAGNAQSPYTDADLRNGTRIIGTGSPGLAVNGTNSCAKNGPETSCETTTNGTLSLNGGDRCVFPECRSGDGIEAGVWHSSFDGWNGHVTATASPVDNGDGTFTYSFNVTNPTVSPEYAISHGKHGSSLHGAFQD